MREIFGRLRWPENESVIKIESLAGGLQVGPQRYLGAGSTLRNIDAAMATRAEWVRHVSWSLERSGCFPIVGQAQHSVFVTPKGSLLFKYYEDDEPSSEEVLFDDFLQYLEVAILVRDSMLWHFDGTDPLNWHRVWLDKPLGVPIAAGLAATPFEPATGTRCSAWVRGTLHVVERRSAHFFNDTTIGTPEVAEALQAVRTTLGHHRDLVWIAPAGTVSEAMLGNLPRCARAGGGGCDVLSWGQPHGYLPREYRPNFRWPTG